MDSMVAGGFADRGGESVGFYFLRCALMHVGSPSPMGYFELAFIACVYIQKIADLENNPYYQP